MIKVKNFMKLIAVIVTLNMIVTACTGGQQSQGVQDSSGLVQNSQSAPEEKVFTTYLAANPKTSSPMFGYDFDSLDIINSTRDGLTRLQPDMTTPMGSGLAESWDISEDKTVWTFHLRDAKWSDGTPITAEDFVYTWQTMCAPETGAKYAFVLYVIKNAEKINTGEVTDLTELGAKALDDKTLEITLENPSAILDKIVCMGPFMPVSKACHQQYGEEHSTAPDKMLYSGPFKMTEYTLDKRIVMEKNEDYWDAANVKLDRIVFEFVLDINTRANMFDTGKLDFMVVEPDFIEKYKNYQGYDGVDEGQVQYFQLNMGNEFFGNAKIRKAFNISLNRESFVNDYMKDGSKPAYAIVAPGTPGLGSKDFRDSSYEKYGGELFYDAGTNPDAIKEANKLLDEGLSEVGKTREDLQATVHVITGLQEADKKTAQICQQMWLDALGINVEVRSLKARFDEYKGNFTMGKEGCGVDYLDAMPYLDQFLTGRDTSTKYTNSQFDELINKAMATMGDERTEYMIEAEKILIDDLPIIPTQYQRKNYVCSDRVSGYFGPPCGVKNEYKWIDVK